VPLRSVFSLSIGIEKNLLWAGARSRQVSFSANLRGGFLAIHILSPQLGAAGFNKKGIPGGILSAIYLLLFDHREGFDLIPI